MFGFEWKGKPLIPTKQALDEMERAEIDMYRAVEILDAGFDCSRSRRKGNVYERCMKRGNKILKIVVAEIDGYFKIIHAGIFAAKKGRYKPETEEG